jgi:hypothetical protein
MRSAIHFTNLKTAQLVCKATQRIITGAGATVERSTTMTDSDRARGVGEWVVICTEDIGGFSNSFETAVSEGIQIALAEALREYNPHHPLLTGIWHLRPENIDTKYKHKIEPWQTFMDNVRNR